MEYLFHGLHQLFTLIAKDLRHPLFGDTEDFGQGRYRLSLLVSRADFGIAVALSWRAIRDRRRG